MVEKGTTNGIITDVDGKFSLNIAPGAVLQISYIGYNTQEIKVSGRNVINVTLMENTQDLDEVIVVAYGSMKKSSYTGSASVIKTEQLEKFSGTGFTDALQGLSAGVNVTSMQVIREQRHVLQYVVLPICRERLLRYML